MRLLLDFISANQKRSLNNLVKKYNIPCKIDREEYYKKTRKYCSLYIDYENFLILKETFLKEIKPKQPYYKWEVSSTEKMIYEIERGFNKCAEN